MPRRSPGVRATVLAERTPGRHRRPPVVAIGALLLAVGVTATCLRSPVTAVGAELAVIRSALGLGPTTTGVLTALPLVVFAVAGWATPGMVRHVGARRVVLCGVAVVAVALLARAAAGSATDFLVATVVALTAAAWVNVVLPPTVAHRSAWATGVFSTGVLVGLAAPAALAVPIGTASGLDWRAGVGVWALLAVLALLVWPTAAAALPAPVPPDAAVTRPLPRAGGRGPLAPPRPGTVALAVFFGAPSLGAFAVMGWLPEIHRDAGADASTASLLLAATVVLALPAALVLPVVVRRGDAGTSDRCVPATGGWTVPLAVLAAVALVQLVAGLRAAGPVGATPTPSRPLTGRSP